MLTATCESLHFKLVELKKNYEELSADESFICEEIQSGKLTEKQKENRYENLKEIEYQIIDGAKKYNEVEQEFKKQMANLNKLQNGN